MILNNIATGIGCAVIGLCLGMIVVEGYSKVKELVKKYKGV